MKSFLFQYVLLLNTVILFMSADSCGQSSSKMVSPLPGAKPNGFTLMESGTTGVNFINRLEEKDLVRNHSLMNGSGIALADVDGDGLCDLYFCGMADSNRLYRNLGNWKFEEVTDAFGVSCGGQLSKGAVFADVDGDRDPDLLVSSMSSGIRLFINHKGVGFQETTELSSDLVSRFGTTSMALADIDGDGDLDLYAANFGERLVLKSGARISTRMVGGKTRVTGRYADKIKIINGNLVEFGAPDALFLNDGAGHFRRVSWSQGFFNNQDGSVMEEPSDFGLAVMFYDVNQDRYPDIFVCNDFHTPDRLWINDGQGRFNEMSGSAFRVMSYASMGVDFADIDRDGLPDIFVTEMLSRRLDHRKRQQKTLFRGESPGLLPQVPRNMLYHQRKDLTFSEIAWYSGVEASDWSWSPVFLDVDLDGYEDLLVTNGHLHNPNDRDRLAKRSDEKRTMRASSRDILSAPEIRVPNLLFRNLGNWKFREIGQDWGFSSDRISHGMALGDLDNDGDLDIVVNCLNEECLIYRNETTAPRIAVKLRGLSPNTMGVGARIEVTAGEMTQTQEILSGGRYLSGDDSIRVFAALEQEGTSSQIKVFWRSGKVSIVKEVSSNRIYEVQEPESMDSTSFTSKNPLKNAPLFLEFRDRLLRPKGNISTSPAFGFERQALLPYGAARIGSRVSWIDVDRDGRVDLVTLMDSAPGHRNGIRVCRFEKEHMTFLSLFTDSNPEYIINGVGGILSNGGAGGLFNLLIPFRSVSLPFEAEHNAGLILSTGNGSNQKYKKVLFEINRGIPSTVAMADIDDDGHLEVFVGFIPRPEQYPIGMQSCWIRNSNGEIGIEETEMSDPDVVGGITGVVFSDLDGDGIPDLVLSREWGSLLVFMNRHGRFVDATSRLGLDSFPGLWQSVQVADFDNDGRMDLLACNRGLNSPIQADSVHPYALVVGKPEHQESYTLIEAGFDRKLSDWVPRTDLEDLRKVIPSLKLSYKEYSSMSLDELLTLLPYRMERYEIRELRSMIFLNRGDRFEAIPLPEVAQISPVNHAVVADFNLDGFEDIFLAQNCSAVPLSQEGQESGVGQILQGLGNGRFLPLDPISSGIRIFEDQVSAAVGDLNQDGCVDLAVVGRSGGARVFVNQSTQRGRRIRLNGHSDNPFSIGAQLRLHDDTHWGAVHEIHGGSGDGSQDEFVQILAAPFEETHVWIRWPGGKEISVTLPSDVSETVNVKWEE